jgi:DNA-binding CsgD family transcriptional regulator
MGQIASGIGIAILGSAGVGKSRMLHEMVDRAGRRGMAVVRAVASNSTRSIPFAPFVELLPDGPTQDRLAMLGSARSALVERSGREGVLVTVDDAHHLDETSLAFLLGIVEAGTATIAMTARTGEHMEPDLVGLWTNGVIARVDLEPLDRERSGQLVESTLGNVSADVEEELWRLAQGNPLLFHEVVEGAKAERMIVDRDGVWELEGRPAESARLADLVTSRLHALPDTMRHAMGVIALGSPLPLDLAIEVVGGELADLEDRGLVSVVTKDHDPWVVPAHPLYGEILAANLPEVRRRASLRNLVEASVADSPVFDALRSATWQMQCGSVVSIELAVAGAAEALVRHDPALAERLIRPVGLDDDRAVAVLGRALSYQRRFTEAEQVLAERAIDDQSVLGEIVSIRAQNLGYGLGRIDEARRLLAEGAQRVDDPAMRARLNNERGMISAIRGDFADVRMASHAVLSDEQSDGVAKVAAYVALTVGLAMTGDCDGLDAIMEEASALAAIHRPELPFAGDQVEIMHAMSLLNAGRIEEAVSLAQLAVDRSDRGNAMTATWLSAFALCLDFSGRLDHAAVVAASALHHRGIDPFGLEPQYRGVLALALGQRGDEDAGAPVSNLTLETPSPRLTVWVDRGRAWAAAARGQLDRAVDTVVSGGRHAKAGEHDAWAAFCFHDAVRLGRPELVLEAMRAIDDSKGAFLISAMRHHAEALADGDPAGLANVANLFAEMGAALLAAEAWARSASLYESRGQELDAARMCVLSLTQERRCESPDTPALRDRPALVSEREVEVAVEAVSGRTSPQIAEKLFISARTVENHLRSVYRKLGVSGRDELARVFQTTNE